MNDIRDFLFNKNIEAVQISDSIFGNRIEFKIYDCDIRIKVTDKLNLKSFLSDANNQYLEYLKRQHSFYKSMSEGFEKSVKEFKPVIY